MGVKVWASGRSMQWSLWIQLEGWAITTQKQIRIRIRQTEREDVFSSSSSSFFIRPTFAIESLHSLGTGMWELACSCMGAGRESLTTHLLHNLGAGLIETPFSQTGHKLQTPLFNFFFWWRRFHGSACLQVFMLLPMCVIVCDCVCQCWHSVVTPAELRWTTSHSSAWSRLRGPRGCSELHFRPSWMPILTETTFLWVWHPVGSSSWKQGRLLPQIALCVAKEEVGCAWNEYLPISSNLSLRLWLRDARGLQELDSHVELACRAWFRGSLSNRFNSSSCTKPSHDRGRSLPSVTHACEAANFDLLRGTCGGWLSGDCTIQAIRRAHVSLISTSLRTSLPPAMDTGQLWLRSNN